MSTASERRRGRSSAWSKTAVSRASTAWTYRGSASGRLLRSREALPKKRMPALWVRAPGGALEDDPRKPAPLLGFGQQPAQGGPPGHPELAVDAGEVELHAAPLDRQLPGDLLVRQVAPGELRYPALGAGQPGQQAGRVVQGDAQAVGQGRGLGQVGARADAGESPARRAEPDSGRVVPAGRRQGLR